MFYGAVKLQPLPTNLFCRNKFCHRWENSFALRSDKNLNAYPSIFCQLKSTFSELLKIIINSKQQVKQIHTLENQKVPRRVCWNTLSLPPKGPTATLSLLHVLEIFKQSPRHEDTASPKVVLHRKPVFVFGPDSPTQVLKGVVTNACHLLWHS